MNLIDHTTEENISAKFSEISDTSHTFVETFRIIFENMLDGVCLINTENSKNEPNFVCTIKAINPAFTRFTTFNEEEVLQKDLCILARQKPKFSHEKEIWIHFLLHLVKDQYNLSFDAHFSKLQQWFHFSLSKPKPDYLIISFSDISQRKQIEQELLNSKKILTDVFSSTRDIIYRYNILEKKYDYVSTALETMLGYPKEIAEAKTLSQRNTILHPDDVETEFQNLKLILGSKIELREPINREYRIRDSKGIYHWVSDTSTVIYNTNKVPIATIGSARDITEQKCVQDKLREQGETLQAFFNQANDIIILLDNEFRIKNINKSFVNLLGYYREEILGKKLDVFLGDNTEIDRFTRLITKLRQKDSLSSISPTTNPASQAFENEDGQKNDLKEEKDLDTKYKRYCPTTYDNQSQIHDFTFSNCHNQEIPLELNFTVINKSNLQEYLILGRDISERRRKDEEIARVDRAESISLLAGGIAHDFNNILTAVLGNIELLQFEDINKDQRELILGLKQGAMRGKDLTQQLLSFTKGGTPIKKSEDLGKLLNESIKLVLSGSKSKSMVFIDPELPKIKVDASQISQVLNNLLINADQSMPEGGLIRITMQQHEVFNSTYLPLIPGRYVKISIRDEGKGIEKEDRSKVFDPYFTTKKHGNGLGLASSFSIIKHHNGHITFETRKDMGTTFFIYLPLIPSEKSQEFITEKIMEKKIEGRVLFMDDEEAIHKIMRKILAKLNLSIVSAYNGEDTIKLYKKSIEDHKKFDLVIMDLTIPGGMGGKDAINHIKEIDPSIKAIVSSGYSNEPILANFKDYGFVGNLPKPYTMKEVEETLKKVL